MEEKDQEMLLEIMGEAAGEAKEAAEEAEAAGELLPDAEVLPEEETEVIPGNEEEAEEMACETELQALEAESDVLEEVKKENGPEKKDRPGRKRRILAIIAAILILATIGAFVIPAIAGGRNRIKSEVVMTVNKHKVYKDEFEYYLYDMINYYSQYYGADYFANDASFKDLKDYVKQYLEEHYVVYTWAESSGFKLTDEMVAANKEAIDKIRANYETEEEFQTVLANNHMTEDLYLRFLNTDAVISAFSNALSSGESLYHVTDEELPVAIDSLGIYGAKHILILSVEDETENEVKKALAQTLYERLVAGEDFDTLMKEYSEDEGLETYPNGYTFGPNEMVEEFYEGTKALEIGEFSEPVESDYGWHIIMRIEPDNEEARSRALNELINEGYEQKLIESDTVVNQVIIDAMSYKDYIDVETE